MSVRYLFPILLPAWQKWLFAITIVTGSMLSRSTHAALGEINLRITATLVASGCSVRADSDYKTVNLGSWSSSDFLSGSKGVTPTRFVINLEKCGVGTSGVSVTFSGTPDNDDNTLLGLSPDSTATHIGIAILDAQRKRIPIGKVSMVYPLKSGDSNTPLVFYGQYVNTGSTITTGTANAYTVFSLEYQ